jgi:hypothetical protein
MCVHPHYVADVDVAGCREHAYPPAILVHPSPQTGYGVNFRIYFFRSALHPGCVELEESALTDRQFSNNTIGSKKDTCKLRS